MSTVTGTDGKTYTLGSTEYTNYLLGTPLGTSATTGTYAPPPATAPTTTSQTTTSPSLQYPTTSPTYGNTSNAAATVSGADKYFADLQQMIKDQEAQQLEQQKIYADSQKSLLGKLSSSLTSPTEARQQAQDTTGIIPKEYFADQKARIAEIDTLNQEYNATVAARDQQIAGSRDKLGSNNFINNQIAQIERNAAPKLNQLSANINSKAAVMKALQGNFAEAQNFVNQAVQDAVADNKYKYDLFNTMYEINKDTFDSMDSIYKESFSNSLALAKMQYEESYKEKTAIGAMMIDPALRGAGINITDTYEEALAKAQAVAGPNYLATQNLIHGDKGGTTNSTTGLTKELQEDFQLEMAFIAGIGEGAPQTREEASEFLRKSYTALASKYGDANFELLRKELDRLYPPAGTSTTQSSGGFLSSFKGLFSSPKPISTSTTSPTSLLPSMTGYKPLSLQPVEQSFFGNLFSQ